MAGRFKRAMAACCGVKEPCVALGAREAAER
jgi:hypothetical protein